LLEAAPKKEFKMIKKHWGITLLLGLMMSGLPLVAQSALEREIKDRAEIEKLMWQYGRALDIENADAYVRLIRKTVSLAPDPRRRKATKRSIR
jgi:hypothetical protein